MSWSTCCRLASNAAWCSAAPSSRTWRPTTDERANWAGMLTEALRNCVISNHSSLRCRTILQDVTSNNYEEQANWAGTLKKALCSVRDHPRRVYDAKGLGALKFIGPALQDVRSPSNQSSEEEPTSFKFQTLLHSSFYEAGPPDAGLHHQGNGLSGFVQPAAHTVHMGAPSVVVRGAARCCAE